MDKQAVTKPVITDAESKAVDIEYKIIAVNTFSCFPQLIVEGIEIDGTSV